jgi:hypothetical protein
MSKVTLIQRDFEGMKSLIRQAFESTTSNAVEFKEGLAVRVFNDDGLSQRQVKELVRRYLRSGHELKAVPGGEAGYTHFDAEVLFQAVIDMQDEDLFPKGYFVKVALIDEDPDEPMVQIVSAHAAWKGDS